MRSEPTTVGHQLLDDSIQLFDAFRNAATYARLHLAPDPIYGTKLFPRGEISKITNTHGWGYTWLTTGTSHYEIQIKTPSGELVTPGNLTYLRAVRAARREYRTTHFWNPLMRHY